MNKIKFIVLAFVTMFIVSCSLHPDSDAEKLADLMKSGKNSQIIKPPTIPISIARVRRHFKVLMDSLFMGTSLKDIIDFIIASCVRDDKSESEKKR